MSFYKPVAFPRAINERRHDRHPLAVQSRVRELGAPASPGRIKDVSVAGCRLDAVELPRNAEVWVTLGESRPLRARVVWVRSDEAGCEFYTPLSRADLRNIMLQRAG